MTANQEAGYKYVDYNGEQQIGVSYVQGTTINGRRCSVEKAFLRPVRERPNLTILTEARATQILIDPETREAFGVKFMRKGRSYTALAKKEVILSAGTFHSPQLLMVSGKFKSFKIGSRVENTRTVETFPPSQQFFYNFLSI